jgi:hypothetical protein
VPKTLTIALSPYHLATRELPAMAALILGDHVVTLVPQPAAGASREHVRAAVKNSPRYLRLMESWRWSTPLWNSGVITSGMADEEACDELPGVYESIASEESLAGLRVLTRGARERAAENADKSLDFVAGDLLRGGPDPGINIPIAAALDRFASRHGLCVARSGAVSIAQRAEARLGTKLFSVAIPVLERAGGGRVQLLRNDLESELGALRGAIRAILDVSRREPAATPTRAGLVDKVAHAAERYSAAFRRWAVEGARGDDENAERVTSGYVSITGMLMPADAVLRASRVAIESLGGPGHRTSPATPPADASPERLAVLIVREMNVQPDHSAAP